MSAELMHRARARIPGGVNSPVRAFGAVGGEPFFVARGEGAELVSTDGRRYLDYVQSWGASILGHAHPEVVAAISEAAGRGTSYGAPTVAEVTLAEEVSARVGSVDKLRLVSSGTEATMSAVRLARGVTGRDLLLKFAGCYHGHVDALLAAAGSGLATFGLPDSAGVPVASVAQTIVLEFNDPSAVDAAFERHGDAIAAVVVEGVPANMGVVEPAEGFLARLRDRCDAAGSLLIVDEVITGFRLGDDGAQGRYGVAPDLSCFGKVIGGGLPLAAFGGRAELMDHLAPIGPVYQAGTLSGNPLATAAGLAVLRLLDRGAYETLERKAGMLAAGLRRAIGAAGLPVQVPRVGPLVGVFFSETPVSDYQGARAADGKVYAAFFHALLDAGIFFPPSPFEALFVSLAHSRQDLERTIEAAGSAARMVVGQLRV